MKDYRKFLKNISVLIAIVGVIVLYFPVLFSFMISDQNHFVASSIDKEKRLKNLKSPKLVIIGGSGSAFSVNSKALEDSLKIPAVNMAIAYGLGLNFMLEEVKADIGKGDKILIINEYYLPLQGNFKLLTLLNDVNPNAKEYFQFDIIEWIKFKTINFQRVGSSLFYKIKNRDENEKTAFRSSYNENGDMVAHLNEPNKRPLKDNEELPKMMYNKEIEVMNKFVNLAEKRGASVFYCFPAYPKSEFEKNKTAIKIFEEQMMSNFKGKVLGSAEQNTYADDDFYDTIYHLNKNGREKRLKYLLAVLKPNIN